jgi:hypothetical protein
MHKLSLGTWWLVERREVREIDQTLGTAIFLHRMRYGVHESKYIPEWDWLAQFARDHRL